jgi:hypothetical protein
MAMVRDVVATELLASHIDFTDLVSLTSLINLQNPSVCGFVVEQAMLSSIALKGLDIGMKINTPMEVVSFVGPKPQFRTDTPGKPTLYRPQKFNFECIDGIIVLIQKPMKKAGHKVKLLMFRSHCDENPILILIKNSSVVTANGSKALKI